MTECENVGQGVICGEGGGWAAAPRASPTLLRLPYLASDIGVGATASGQGNGLAAVVMAGR